MTELKLTKDGHSVTVEIKSNPMLTPSWYWSISGRTSNELFLTEEECLKDAVFTAYKILDNTKWQE